VKKIFTLVLACSFPVSSIASPCNPLQSKACNQSIEAKLRQAVAFNVSRHYTEAADLLERVLMEYPDSPSAMKQYSLALAGIDEAMGLVHDQPQPDTHSRDWQVNSGLQLRSGYSSNLNQAPTKSTLQLTLPSGPIALELMPQFRQQAGFGAEAQLTGNALRTLAKALQWRVRGELFNRQTDYGGYADYQGSNVLTSLMQQGKSGAETGVALGFNALRYNSDVYLYTSQLMLRHSGAKGSYCQPQGGVDLLWQRQAGNSLLDSRYAGLMAGLFCDTQLGLYNASISTGWDWATSLRPGGDQLRGRLELSGIWSTDVLSQGSFIKASGNILQSHDQQAYSAWLGNGATRYVNRTGANLDYDWSLKWVADNWRGVASVKWQNQNSNISLFEMNSLEGWMGVRMAW
jgi:hypothetical protein